MADDFVCYVSSPNATFSEFVDESKTDGNSFSVLTWGNDGNTYRLYIDHIVETQSDDDYYYELYYTNGFSTNGISSTSGLGNYVCCVRYSKYEKISEFDKTNLYMHNMKYSDYKSAFGSNLKNSSIYSWHGNDYCVNFYWHGFSGERPVTPQSWIISNDIPYKTIFPTLYQLSEYPNTLWRQVNGKLPYKTCFPEMIRLSAPYPSSLWIQIPGELPYKTCFPPLYPPKKAFIPKKYKTYEIKLYDYMHDVVIRKDVSK